jgi:NitT/TauT family transport system permease protein
MLSSVTGEHSRQLQPDGHGTARRAADLTRSLRPRLRLAGHVAIYAVSILVFLGAWEEASRSFYMPILFPGPLHTFRTMLGLLYDGSLLSDAAISMMRILIGFAIGSLIGFALGVAIGASPLVRYALDPYVNFLRFVSGIAWIQFATLWLGLGETSKIALVSYVTIFAVAINTFAGFVRIPRNRRRAALSSGASPLQRLVLVDVPSTVHFALQGMRLAMAGAFLTVVAAEMVAANSGLGFLINSSREFMATDVMFVAILALAVLGYVTDKLFVFLSDLFLGRFRLSIEQNTMDEVPRLSSPAGRTGSGLTRPAVVWCLSLAAFVSTWGIASLFYPPALLPSPARTLGTAMDSLRSGLLVHHAGASLVRVLAGFAIGSAAGAVVGLAAGCVMTLRLFFDPLVNVLRFVPAVAMLTPFVVWFGIGETSKVLLIVFATVFIVILNTIAGVDDVPRNRRRAAEMLGAGPWNTFRLMIVPSVVPYILTGMRIALGVSFASIIVAEMVSANTGLGYLLSYARVISATDLQIVAILCIGTLGWVTDKILQLLVRLARRRYD